MEKNFVVYGIPNCDTVKKSRAWFTAQGIAVEFHDFKKQGVPQAALERWIQVLGWEAMVNKKGTTWRKLSLAQKEVVVDAAAAIALMLRESSVIKRPVVEGAGMLTVGFAPEQWIMKA
ncbi:MAG: Spx/MgsR family RNA polymerase-binding regulatory protein [Brachymonas sp.]|nr:Spx/MgsR family RNA polymerase-binding regulatory protein [Brachymonas sp.]